MKYITALTLLLFLSMQIKAQEVGIIMGTARDYLREDTEQGLIKLKNLGIKYLEGAGSRNMPRAQYKTLLDKYGFDVVAGGVNFDKLENADSIRTIIENLKFFDAEYAVCYWIPHKGDDFTFTDMQKGVEVFNRAGKQLAEAGISLLYHAHGYEFRPYPGPGTMYDYMMENLDPRYVNIEMDVFWMRNPGQDPAALLRKYPGRFPITHLKDRMIGSVDNLNGRQDTERNVVLGTGDVNIAEVMKASKEVGVKYHFIEDESSRAGTQLPLHLAYLKSLDYDVQGVELSVERLHKAIVDADSLALMNLTTEELTYGHSSGAVENRQLFISNLLSGKSDFAKIEVTDQDVTVKGDVAWVRLNMAAELVNAGAITPIALKMLYIWTRACRYPGHLYKLTIVCKQTYNLSLLLISSIEFAAVKGLGSIKVTLNVSNTER
ncbi:MAG: TIM barrel protein [Saprospiraceae bacterium]|nr:TIM barrel protein [Saprospiraceae bacterium]